jgi:hypothetical protein
MAPRPFVATPEQQQLLDEVSAAADKLAVLEQQRKELRTRRDQALLAAVRADVPIAIASDAARLRRQNGHGALKRLGYTTTPDQD